jgi:anti-sigma regulatory factor (Ser/Thr protein kinase)
MSLRPPAADWFPGAGRSGKGGCGDGQGGGPGERDACRAARVFVGEVLGPGHPCGDAAVLLVSEIFGNSFRHSGSAAPGETVTVAVRAGDSVVRVEVTDRAGPGTPELRPAGCDGEGGRGLQLVAGLAACWGWRRRGGRMVTRYSGAADLPARRCASVAASFGRNPCEAAAVTHGNLGDGPPAVPAVFRCRACQHLGQARCAGPLLRCTGVLGASADGEYVPVPARYSPVMSQDGHSGGPALSSMIRFCSLMLRRSSMRAWRLDA